MNAADYVLDSLADMDRYVCLLAGSRGTPDVVAAVREYLAAWPAERVARVQRLDAGWAPFDESQRPAAIDRPADVHRACNAVHEQCMSLRGAAMVPAPELLELDLFLFLASAKLAELDPATSAAARAPQPAARAANAGAARH